MKTLSTAAAFLLAWTLVPATAFAEPGYAPTLTAKVMLLVFTLGVHAFVAAAGAAVGLAIARLIGSEKKPSRFGVPLGPALIGGLVAVGLALVSGASFMVYVFAAILVAGRTM